MAAGADALFPWVYLRYADTADARSAYARLEPADEPDPMEQAAAGGTAPEETDEE
jgi:hypothetical protein